MQLHPAHVEAGTAAVQPIKLSQVELLVAQRMLPAEAAGQVYQQALVIYSSPGSDEVLSKVSLLGVEVSLREEEDQAFILLSQVDGPFTLDADFHGEPDVWLFRSQDGLDAAQGLLEAMGASGAVRKDLQLSWDPSPLASGAMASVHMATSTFRGSVQTCVIKMFGQGACSDPQTRICQEVAILSQVQSSPHIVQMLGLWTAGAGVFRRGGLLMECCTGGDAQTAAIQKPFQEFQALDIICELLQGLSHLHALGIIHRDIKPANILFREGGSPVIADFGFACFVSERHVLSKRLGSPGYVAPEIITGKGASAKSDIFSTGCTLYFMISGIVPFGRPDDDVRAILASTLADSLHFSDPIFAFVSAGCKRFMRKLTKKSVSSRASAAQALIMQYSHSSSSDGTDDELLPMTHTRSVQEVPGLQSLPSVEQQGDLEDSKSRFPDPPLMPRSTTVSPFPLRPRQAARSLTSDA